VIVDAFERRRGGAPPPDASRLWATVENNEAVLESEMRRKIREYEGSGEAERSV
jgi:hypothetical protein